MRAAMYNEHAVSSIQSIDWDALIALADSEGNANFAHDLGRRTVVFTITAGDKICELDSFYPSRGRSCDSREKLLVV